MAGRDNFYMATFFQRGSGVHAVVPLRSYVTPNPHFVPSVYGDPYGASKGGYLLSVLQVRYSRTNLQERRANVSTYDHYDAVKDLIDQGRSYADIEAFPYYSQFTTLASNDASAMLKTAYWLAVGFLALNDTSLKDAANERLESGYNMGIDIDAANRSGSIKSTYDSAYTLLERAMKRRGGTNEVATDALEQLRRGTDRKAVQTRVEEAQTQAGQRQKVEEAGPPKKPDAACEDTWLNYIPGYCTAKAAGDVATLGVKIVGGVLLTGIAIWGVKRIVKQVKSNPLSDAYNPSKKKPMPALADKQEAYLAKTVFRKRIA